MACTQPIRNKKHIKRLAEYFLRRGQFRNHLLLILGLHTALRISDMLLLKWEDVYDFQTGAFCSHITITEGKTGKQKIIALHPQIIKALALHFPHRRGAFLFASNRRHAKAISRVQAWRVLHKAALAVGITGQVGCHALRKTFGYHAWVSGISPVVLMAIYNHSSYAVTRRYLGVTQDDTDKVYLAARLL